MVEMMIVVSIAALLTAMSIYSAKSYFEKARAKECRLNQQAIFNAVWNWRIDNQFLPGTSVTNFRWCRSRACTNQSSSTVIHSWINFLIRLDRALPSVRS